MDYLLYLVSTFYGVRSCVRSCVCYQKTGTQHPGHNARLHYRMVREEIEKRRQQSRPQLTTPLKIRTARSMQVNSRGDRGWVATQNSARMINARSRRSRLGSYMQDAARFARSR